MSIAISSPTPKEFESREFTETYAHGSVADAQTAIEQYIPLGGEDSQHASGILVTPTGVQVFTAGTYFVDIYLEIVQDPSGGQIGQVVIIPDGGSPQSADVFVITNNQRYFRGIYVFNLQAKDTISVRPLSKQIDTQLGDYVIYRLA